MGQVLLPPRVGTNKITLEGYDHLTWRGKIIPYIRTDNCIDMSNMFSGENYQLPETLDLRRFNTSKVTDMRAMFDHCMSTSILGLENFNTSKVTDMSFMFNEAHIVTLDTSNLDTSKVTTMENMFCNCPAEVLDVSGFNTELVTNMSCLFEGVPAELDVSGFETSLVTTMHNMFKNTGSEELDVSNFSTSLVTDMSGMFDGAQCEELDVSNFDTSSVTNMSRMFAGLSLDELDISNFDLSNVRNMGQMFLNCTFNSLIQPEELDLSNVTNIYGLFYNLTIPSLDMRDWNFSAITTRRDLFYGLHTNTLDLSTWDLGEHVSESSIYGGVYSSASSESLFNNADIDNLIFSDSNNFPENYYITSLFGNFKTSGILDLSSFHFNNAYVYTNNTTGLFYNSKINTLILPDITEEAFYTTYSSGVRLFYKTAVELLDMSNATFSISKGTLFDGLTATRINAPNIIPSSSSYWYSSGLAKYVDYSSVNTINANYNSTQYLNLSYASPNGVKIMWIPSTFVLDGLHNMRNLGQDTYTDAADYTELGWQFEPTNVRMHYNSTHEDFEQAILDDNPNEWVSPRDYPIFFCHTHVPLGTAMNKYQFESDDYTTVNVDGEDVNVNDYVFDEVGEHVLKITVNNYDFYQTVQVDDHGEYTTLYASEFYCYKPVYNSSSRSYSYQKTKSTQVEFRLYNDKYLFVYPLARLTATRNAYYRLESPPNTSIQKISGVPFQIGQVSLRNCRALTDVSELIVCTTEEAGFYSNQMFSQCSNLTDVSSVGKWKIRTDYTLRDTRSGASSSSIDTGNYPFDYTFAYSGITAAPAISIPSNSTDVFYNCTQLVDISKLTGIGNDCSGVFNNCSSLSNVSHLKVLFKRITSTSLMQYFQNTAITNTDFIPENFPVKYPTAAFYNCRYLTDLTGVGRIKWIKQNNGISFYNMFYDIPATDYSPLANWDCLFNSIDMCLCKMSNLDFMQNWDLSKCTYYSFESCSNLASLSGLKNKIRKDVDVEMRFPRSGVVSCDGLQGVNFSSIYFADSTSLQTADGLQGCTIKACTSLFSGCTSLTDISALSEVTFDISGGSMQSLLSNCKSLTSLNGLQNLDVSNCTTLNYTFNGCEALTNISAIAGWNPYQVRTINGMFNGCKSITSFSALSDWITGQLTSATQAFTNCTSLQTLNGLNGINIGQCTDLSNLFSGCTSLTDISGIMLWFVGNCTNMYRMFGNCPNLTSVAPIRYWMVSKLTSMQQMFDGDTSIADAELLNDWTNYRTMTSVSRNYAFRNVPKPWPTWAVS